jgi:hypothetical protein
MIVMRRAARQKAPVRLLCGLKFAIVAIAAPSAYAAFAPRLGDPRHQLFGRGAFAEHKVWNIRLPIRGRRRRIRKIDHYAPR